MREAILSPAGDDAEREGVGAEKRKGYFMTDKERKEEICYAFVSSHYTKHTAPSSAHVHTSDGAYTNSVVLINKSGVFYWEANDLCSFLLSLTL